MQLLISYSDFSKLRLNNFCSGDVARTGAAIWEWMGGQWHCDAIGFTWFGRLDGMPDETGCMELHLSELPQSESEAILAAVQLPLVVGMTRDAVVGLLGDPINVLSFVEDRKTYVFRAGSRDDYQVDCTIQENAGLIFVSIVRSDVLAKIESSNR